MSEIKIQVSTHDNDTTDVSLSLNGSSLEVNLGENTASLDLSDIPEQNFQPGSKVIAFDKEGHLYKFAETSSYYKDIAIELSAENGTKLDNQNTQYTVTARISNTKETEVSSASVLLSTGGGR